MSKILDYDKGYSWKVYSLYKQNKNLCQTSQHKNNNRILARILNTYLNLQLFKVLACILIIKISIFKLKQRRVHIFWNTSKWWSFYCYERWIIYS
jgi:hypothetical protein